MACKGKMRQLRFILKGSSVACHKMVWCGKNVLKCEARHFLLEKCTVWGETKKVGVLAGLSLYLEMTQRGVLKKKKTPRKRGTCRPLCLETVQRRALRRYIVTASGPHTGYIQQNDIKQEETVSNSEE